MALIQLLYKQTVQKGPEVLSFRCCQRQNLASAAKGSLSSVVTHLCPSGTRTGVPAAVKMLLFAVMPERISVTVP